MMRDRNPQAEQMGDESMVRNLAYQADAIWRRKEFYSIVIGFRAQ